MANRKQLAILKQGVETWNKWRKENPDEKIDLRGAKLDGLDLSGANLSKADIRGTSFKKSILNNVNFQKSNACKGYYIIIFENTISLIVIIFLSFVLLSSVEGDSLKEVFNFSYAYLILLFILSPILFFTNIIYLLLSIRSISLQYILVLFIVILCICLKQNFFTLIFLFIYINSRFENNIWIFLRNFLLYISIFKNTDFRQADLKGAIFDYTCFNHVHFGKAILSGTSFNGAYGIQFAGCNGTILNDRDVRELLVRGNGQGLYLKRKNIQGACLVNADLRDLDLRETKLMQANLSGADITGAKLWGSAREGWIIDGIRCEYVYWDEAGEVRTPPDRDFRPGEFEELYKQLPSFEYVFAQGFTPLDPLIMDRVVQAINEQHREFALELVNFDKRGEPHATFTVCRLDYVEKAKEQITAGYEASKGSPEQQAQLMAAVLGLIENQSKSLDIIKQLGGATNMGDIYNISGGQIGAVGQSASASGNIFQQITPELSRLHEAMRNAAANPAQHAAADEVAKAEQAAKQQDEPKMRQHLKNAGKFAVDCAKTIGTDVAAEYLKKMTLGM